LPNVLQWQPVTHHVKHSEVNSASAQPIIQLRDVVFRRGSRLILDHVDMDIPRGAIVAVMGPSGVGKTTVLRLISGQLRPDSGSILVNGEEVSGMTLRQLYKLREQLGFLLQNGALFTDLTVFENVATPLREHTGHDEATITRLVGERLDAVGLKGTEELMPHELSGGMARRVALARAVILDPAIVLFDEPMAGLDPIALSTINQLIRETNDALGLTSVVVTHDVDQMVKLVDYCYILAGGRIAGQGTPAELANSSNPAVDQFMNGKMDGPIPFRYQGAAGA
jgi:phospholipid/cholesterol/gamma-HCH transport system ATP-binding protein